MPESTVFGKPSVLSIQGSQWIDEQARICWSAQAFWCVPKCQGCAAQLPHQPQLLPSKGNKGGDLALVGNDPAFADTNSGGSYANKLPLLSTFAIGDGRNSTQVPS